MPDELTYLAAAVEAEQQTEARRHLQSATPGQAEGALELLAAQAAAGSPLATELLIEQLDESGLIARVVRAALLDESAVEDVSQDALISVAGSIHSFRGGSKVTTWVHQVVRNRVVDHLRRQRATAPLPEDQLSPTARMSSMIATRATVQQALAELPDLYRDPVTLRDIEGLTYAEVAQRLERNLGTVKAQVSRGRALVAASLRDDGESP